MRTSGIFGRLLRDAKGGIAITFAISLPALAACLGLASDYAMMLKLKGDLQAAADAAAIAGALEIPLANHGEAQVIASVRSHAAFALSGSADFDDRYFTLKANVVESFSAVDVSLTQAWTPYFAQALGYSTIRITVSSRARNLGSGGIALSS